MKIFFYFLMVLIFTAFATNIYSFFHKGFFWAPFSKVINIGTPVVLFIYLLLFIINKRRSNKKLYDHYSKISNKN